MRKVILELLAILALGYFVVFLTVPAKAQDKDIGHTRYHEYYKHWKQPGSFISCCNARETDGYGNMTGDCEPVIAEILNGSWWAWSSLERKMIEIPDRKIIHERNPSYEEGHLCQSNATLEVLCFVPPFTGG